MNYFLKILGITMFVVILAGCSDSFLDEEAKDKIYAENLFTDRNGFNSAKHALLSMVREERGESTTSLELGLIWKVGTDVAWAPVELSFSKALNQYSVTNLTPSWLFVNGDAGKPGLFQFFYNCINLANMVIGRAENQNVNWQGANEEDNLKAKNQIVAHARLIRAYCYRHLALSFGPIPISTSEITGSSYRDDWEREPVDSVQALIERDLKFAETYLPEFSNDVTVLSKVVAQHFLTELYLWEGRNAEAVEVGLRAVGNPNYKLITQRYGVKASLPGCAFMDQFYDGNVLPSEGNTEAIWVLPNTAVDGTKGRYNNTMRRTWVSSYNNLNVDYKPEYGGRGIGRCGITAWCFSIYEPQDDRFSEYAVRKKYIDRNGNTIICDIAENKMTLNNHKWASTRKWDWTFDDPIRWNDAYAYGDQPFLRIADTYLLLAEALHKTGNNSEADGAAYWINKVRTRSNATPVTGAEITLDYILDERARELVTEENRRETLVRTGTLIDRVKRHNRIAAGLRDGVPGIQPYHVLLPIPQTIIDSNVGREFLQNEGYK